MTQARESARRVGVRARARARARARLGREWYHDKCTKIPDALWSNSSIEWNCDSCRAK